MGGEKNKASMEGATLGWREEGVSEHPTPKQSCLILKVVTGPG